MYYAARLTAKGCRPFHGLSSSRYLALGLRAVGAPPQALCSPPAPRVENLIPTIAG